MDVMYTITKYLILAFIPLEHFKFARDTPLIHWVCPLELFHVVRVVLRIFFVHFRIFCKSFFVCFLFSDPFSLVFDVVLKPPQGTQPEKRRTKGPQARATDHHCFLAFQLCPFNPLHSPSFAWSCNRAFIIGQFIGFVHGALSARLHVVSGFSVRTAVPRHGSSSDPE